MSGSGHVAEQLAGQYLTRQGLVIVARNYRCRGGEVDLICRDGATLVFVEVRLRSSGRFGGAAASITPRKQARIILAARHYLTGRAECPCRFDAVLLDGPDPARITWLRAAFDAC